MHYGEIFYAMRAACRSWNELADGGNVPRSVVIGLAFDLLALVDHDEQLLHDTRSALLLRRPFSTLDHCVYTTIEVALAKLMPRNAVVDSAAFDAALIASMIDRAGGPHYIVDLLGTYERDVLVDAVEYLRLHPLGELNPKGRDDAIVVLAETIARRDPIPE